MNLKQAAAELERRGEHELATRLAATVREGTRSTIVASRVCIAVAEDGSLLGYGSNAPALRDTVAAYLKQYSPLDGLDWAVIEPHELKKLMWPRKQWKPGHTTEHNALRDPSGQKLALKWHRSPSGHYFGKKKIGPRLHQYVYDPKSEQVSFYLSSKGAIAPPVPDWKAPATMGPEAAMELANKHHKTFVKAFHRDGLSSKEALKKAAKKVQE